HHREAMNELVDIEIGISVEELRAWQLALSIANLAADVPNRNRAVIVLADVVRNIGNDQLRLRDGIAPVILEVVIEDLMLAAALPDVGAHPALLPIRSPESVSTHSTRYCE